MLIYADKFSVANIIRIGNIVILIISFSKRGASIFNNNIWVRYRINFDSVLFTLIKIHCQQENQSDFILIQTTEHTKH